MIVTPADSSNYGKQSLPSLIKRALIITCKITNTPRVLLTHIFYDKNGMKRCGLIFIMMFCTDLNSQLYLSVELVESNFGKQPYSFIYFIYFLRSQWTKD